MSRTALIAVVLLLGTGSAMAADATAGERVFRRQCFACHAMGEDAQHKVGPILNGLIGRPAGSYPDYSYTDANRNSKLVWDEATLANYLKNPKASIPGTKMTLVALLRPSEIEDLIAYLKRFGSDRKRR